MLGDEPLPTPAEPTAAPAPKAIQREAPDPSESRRALVNRLIKDLKRAKSRWKPVFKTMREDMKFAHGYQWQGKRGTDNRVTANITTKHVNGRVAALYAKNPVFTAQRRKRLDFQIWDGKEASLQAASQEMAGGMPSPETMALLQDVQTGITRRRMLDSVGKTLEVVFSHALEEQNPSFKKQLKQVVRRAVTCGVAYVKVGYQRQLAKRPDAAARLADITDRLANIERLQEEIDENESGPDSAEAEELRVALAAVQAEPDVVVREGLVFDYPQATRIIPDTRTRQLSGWVGSDWVAEEYLMSEEEIEEMYQVDIGSAYTGYVPGEYGDMKPNDGEDKKACVWEIYHRKDGVVYTVCDGYPDFLAEPAPPQVYIEQFFPWFALAFNEVEAEEDIFPQSDVRLLRPLQLEINRMPDALRQHRIANRPLYVAQKGKLENQDLKNMAEAAPHDVITVNGLDTGDKIENVIQELKRAGVDPNLYETGSTMNLMQFVVGVQEASMGGTSGDTATESSIAEQSKITSTSSNADDLDDCLSAVARAAGQILLREMDPSTVAQIAGPGAVWPEMNRQQIAEELFLEVEAGSSGRPNKAQDLANFERVAPILIQIPGISPEWLAQYTIKTLDAQIDYEDAITSALPSITTQNAVAGKQVQPSTGDPATDPAQQGVQGAQNDPNNDQSRGGPQAAMPAPGEQPSVMAG